MDFIEPCAINTKIVLVEIVNHLFLVSFIRFYKKFKIIRRLDMVSDLGYKIFQMKLSANHIGTSGEVNNLKIIFLEILDNNLIGFRIWPIDFFGGEAND